MRINNTFFFQSAKFSAYIHVVTGLKKIWSIQPLRFDLLLEGQTNMAQHELISTSFEDNRLTASLNLCRVGRLHAVACYSDACSQLS